MFTIVKVEGKETTICLEPDGKPQLYETGEQAARVAAEYSQVNGAKYQPRPFKGDDNWREREQARFDRGEYEPLPWVGLWWFNPRDEAGMLISCAGAGIPDHFAHVSCEQPGMIAYTESPEKGAADRQTRIKPGRYLEKYFTGMIGEESIRRLACGFSARYGQAGIRFADTEDEIERVYRNGPNSCMSHSPSAYSSPFHPVCVYAAGDLAVAYLELAEGGIGARAICWPAKKIYTRVYGDGDRFKSLMSDLGYRQDRNGLGGARLVRHVTDNDEYVVPYVDGYNYASDNGKYLVIDDEGDISLEQTSGISGERRGPFAVCERCDDPIDHEDDARSVRVARRDWETWCSGCADSGAIYCEDCGDNVAAEHTVRLGNGDSASEWYAEEHCAVCEATGGYYKHDDTVTLADGATWCLDYFMAHGFRCPDCGECFANEDGIEDEETGETVCRECYAARIEDRKQGEMELTARPAAGTEEELFEQRWKDKCTKPCSEDREFCSCRIWAQERSGNTLDDWRETDFPRVGAVAA